MVFLPVINSPNAFEALSSALSERDWLSSRGCSFSVFKREPKNQKQQGNCNVQLEKEPAVRGLSVCLAAWGALGRQPELVGTRTAASDNVDNPLGATGAFPLPTLRVLAGGEDRIVLL